MVIILVKVFFFVIFFITIVIVDNQGGNQFLAPFETFHYIPSVFSAGLGQVGHHPGFVIPDRQTNY